MTVAENVVVGTPALRDPPVEAARTVETVERCLRQAGLWNEVKNRLGEAGGSLSGGQQQRLCIARSLAVRPAGAPDGRAVLGARPDVDAPDRGDDRRAPRAGDDRHRHPQHAAGAARVRRRCAFFLAAENQPGRIVESGPTDEDVRAIPTIPAPSTT